jgi:outer membrane protein TolC
MLCLGSVVPMAQDQTPTGSSASGVGLLDLVQSAIARDPDALLARQQVASSAGDLQTAQGQFDPVLTSSLQRDRSDQSLLASQKNPIANSALQTVTSYAFGLQKQFHSGLTINPNLGVTGTDLNLSPPTNGRGSASVTLVQPLMRGRGTTVTTANLRAARAALGSSEQSYRFTASQVAWDTATAYWSYVAATRTVAVAQAAIERSQRLLSDMQQLVAADQRPSADLKQLQAELAGRTVQKLNAEQQLVSARYQLGMAAGLTIPEMVALPAPADGFPTPPAAPPAWSTEAMVREAMTHRADVEAARQQIDAAKELVVSARDATRPQVNLSATFGFSGLSEGKNDVSRYFRPLFDQLRGGNVTLSLDYQWPIANNIAFGQLAKSQATAEQASIQERESERTVASQVAVAMANVGFAIQQVDAATREAELYRSAVEDERTKLQLGLSTVLDLILTEDRLTQAEIDAINAQAGYAQAVVLLRFYTGTLLTASATPQVALDNLVTLP